MTSHNVLTHQPQRTVTQPHFFILSKGKNAGKWSEAKFTNTKKTIITHW